MGDHCFLQDDRRRIELHFAQDALDGWEMFQTGDQVSVEVLDWVNPADSARVAQPQLHVKSRREHFLKPKPHALEFARFLNRVRGYFVQCGLTEVLTPSLVACPGLEPTLVPFGVDAKYLPTSPEVHLKKALAHGSTDIFEIKPCFRKGEVSPHHQPEFTMLEWYRGFADLQMIERDLRGLLQFLAPETPVEPQVTTFAQLFKEEFGFRLTPLTTASHLRALLQDQMIHCLEEEGFTDLFHRALIERIEPKLAQLGPVIVRDFPPSMAALARLTPEGWADRFEFYWAGLEIANAFNEVTDPREQFLRWEMELAERARLGTGQLPMDFELLEALEAGMPPSGGVALGLERLYMALHGVRDIRELKLF